MELAFVIRIERLIREGEAFAGMIWSHGIAWSGNKEKGVQARVDLNARICARHSRAYAAAGPFVDPYTIDTTMPRITYWTMPYRNHCNARL